MTLDLTHPLYNEPAEQAVISAMLLASHAVQEAVMTIDAGDFYKPAHQRLYGAIMALHDRGDVVDPLTLLDELDRTGQLDAVGGRDAVAYLVDVVPTAANVGYHLKIVAELAQRRALVATAHRLTVAAMDRKRPVAEIAQHVQGQLLEVAIDQTRTGYRRVREMAYEIMQEIEDAHLGKAAGLATGYREIDQHTGGLLPGEIVLLCGIPGGCKTALALNIARNAARRGEGVGIVSIEMKDRQLIKRLLVSEASVNGLDLRRGTLKDRDFVEIGRAMGTMSQWPLWVDDTPAQNLRMIQARARDLKARHPEVQWLLVDFIQLVQGADDDELRALALTNIVYGLQALAKELDVVVIATCQVDAKATEERSDPRPQLRDLRWSQGMREAANLIALLHRTGDQLEVSFNKARDLPPFKATLTWVGQYLRVSDPPDFPKPRLVQESVF